MTRTLLCVAAALAFAVSLPAYDNRAAAQESADAGAEASAESGQSADASAETSGSADAQSSDGQADTQASTSGEASADQAASTENGTAQDAASDASANGQAAESDSPSLPQPAEQTETDADVSAEAGATQEQDEPQQTQPRQRQPADQTDAARGDASQRDRAGVRTDAAAQDRTRVDAQGRRGQQDFRRGIRFGRATNRGLTVNFIQRNSIFFDSGLRQGDIIVSLRGRPVRSEADFIRWMTFHRGERVPVVVLRDGRQETIYIEHLQEAVPVDPPYDAQAGGQAFLGVGFDPQVRDAAIVVTVTPGSPAEQAGLQPDDMLVALNGQEVRSHQDAIAIIRSMQPGDRLSIAFARRMEAETEAVLAGRPGQPVRTATRGAELRIEQRNIPPTNDRSIEIEQRRLDGERRILNRDRNTDRDADQEDERPLLQRLLD